MRSTRSIQPARQLLRSPPVPDRSRPRRAALTRGVLVAAAIEHADRLEPSAFTMRSLGQALNVKAMSLYRYVGTKEELLSLMAVELVDRVTREPTWPPQPDVPDLPIGPARRTLRSVDNLSWQDDVRGVVTAVAAVAGQHTGSLRLLIDGGLDTCWADAARRIGQVVRASLTAAGLDHPGAATGTRIVLRNVLAQCVATLHATPAANTRPACSSSTQAQAPPPCTSDPAKYPHVSRLLPLLTVDIDPREAEIGCLLADLDSLFRHRGHRS